MSAGQWFYWQAKPGGLVHTAAAIEHERRGRVLCHWQISSWWREVSTPDATTTCRRCDAARKKLEAKP